MQAIGTLAAGTDGAAAGAFYSARMPSGPSLKHVIELCARRYFRGLGRRSDRLREPARTLEVEPQAFVRNLLLDQSGRSGLAIIKHQGHICANMRLNEAPRDRLEPR